MTNPNALVINLNQSPKPRYVVKYTSPILIVLTYDYDTKVTAIKSKLVTENAIINDGTDIHQSLTFILPDNISVSDIEIVFSDRLNPTKKINIQVGR